MIQRALAASLLVLLCFITIPLQAEAFDPLGGVDCNTAQERTSAVCADKNPATNPLSGNGGLILNLTQIVAYIAGAAAVILLIIGGIRYITSGGDAANIKSAKDTVIHAIVGLVIIVLAQSLIVFVVNRL